MHKLLALAPVSLLAACALGGNPFAAPRENADSARPAGASTPIEAEGLDIYLATMQALVEGDPVVQAEVFAEVRTAAQTTPTTTNRLRLALALATPGHPGSDPLQAQHDLAEMLAASTTLLPAERSLAAIHLKDVEQRLILDAEARRLRDEMGTARAQQESDDSRRLETALSENRRLRAELDEALQKLDAITNIERSIRERGNGATTP
jgi:hypothetical protein